MKTLTGFFFLSSIVLLTTCHSAPVKNEIPNIIFLLTDDQRWDALGFEGNALLKTPNIDALAARGHSFTNSFVTTPICCTSRASLFTGQYARRHGIINFATPFTDSTFSQTYPALLRQAGYHTGFIGKYGVGNKDKDMPVDRFDYWRGFPGQGHYWMDSVHLTRQMGYYALEFLDSLPKDKPFCLSISFKAPHCQDGDPEQFLYDTTAYADLYAEDIVPVNELADDRYWEMFPDFFQKEDNEARIRWRLRFGSPELYQKMVKNYFKLITGVDDAIGRIMDELERKGLTENTIIIYTSDNGYYLGERGLAGKWYSHDESIRVPLVIFDPRETDRNGEKIEEIALNIDMAPTILSFAGVEVPEVMQGKSLIPLIDKTSKKWRTDFFFEHRFKRHNIPESEGVISLQNKYIRYVKEEPVYEYLYDLQKDPNELCNYMDSLEYGEILAVLKSRYTELLEETK